MNTKLMNKVSGHGIVAPRSTQALSSSLSDVIAQTATSGCNSFCACLTLPNSTSRNSALLTCSSAVLQL